MKSALLRVLAWLVLCWLGGWSAQAQQVTVSLGMSFDQAAGALEQCGGLDIGGFPALPRTSWWMENFGMRVVLGERAGRLNQISYSAKGETGNNDFRPGEISQPVASLKFDVAKKTFVPDRLPAAPTLEATEGRWFVRVELLVVAVPPETALPLLPDLHDESKVDAAYTRIIAAIQRKEARLIDYPVTYSLSGEKADTETNFEKIYPTQFGSPTAVGDPTKGRSDGMPTEFEKRNVGASLEVVSTVRNDGAWIELNLRAQSVEHDGADAYEYLKLPGITGKVEQPRFYSNKDNACLIVRPGRRVLVGVHRSARTGEIELHLIQALATQIP